MEYLRKSLTLPLRYQKGGNMSREEKNRLEYTIALITDFANAYHIKQKQAFNYLRRFKGLDFLKKHYDVMHTQSFEDTIEALTLVCNRNGGGLV